MSEPNRAFLRGVSLRELRNFVEQAVVLAPGDVVGEDDVELGTGAPGTASPRALDALPFGDAKRLAVEGFERDYLLRALRTHDGNISRTAESIGMVRQSLQQKVRELGLAVEEFRRNARD